VTPRELNRTLLARQSLLERKAATVPAAVARLVALQAQWAPSPYVALWSRVDGFRKAQLTNALVRGTVVKAQCLRITLHVVHRRRFGDVIAASMAARPGRMSGEIRSDPIGPWPHTKPSPSAPWPEPLPEPAAAAVRVVRDYLAGYGPATRQDIQQFTGFLMRQIDPALDGLQQLDDDLWDLPRCRLVGGRTAAPVRFLPAFDSIILAHRDRSRIVPPEYLEAVFNRKNATTKNTFTVDGFVAGAWRLNGTKLELEPFAPLPRTWRARVEAEGERLRSWYLAD
jgi:Winged helix DNA-binding domain